MRNLLSVAALGLLAAGCSGQTAPQLVSSVNQITAKVGAPLAAASTIAQADGAVAEAMQAQATANGDTSAASRSKCLALINAPLAVASAQTNGVLGVASLAELAVEEDNALHTAGCQQFVGQVEGVKGDALGLIAGQLPIAP